LGLRLAEKTATAKDKYKICKRGITIFELSDGYYFKSKIEKIN
jgi:hypothetical protein